MAWRTIYTPSDKKAKIAYMLGERQSTPTEWKQSCREYVPDMVDEACAYVAVKDGEVFLDGEYRVADFFLYSEKVGVGDMVVISGDSLEPKFGFICLNKGWEIRPLKSVRRVK
jgi:hypothetical protein